MSRHSNPQALFLDADDTLWENNIYFEEAIADFIQFLNHKEMPQTEVRQVINQIEHEIILERGYGCHTLARSLVRTFERLSADPVIPELHQTICNFAYRISEFPIKLRDGVLETLDYLRGRRHSLILLTKGNFTEQTAKVERSGIKHYFAAVEIVAEKNTDVYKHTVTKYELLAESTWMVGNSPKSDINPAMLAGINAVLVPHDQTWVLEHEPIGPKPERVRLLQLERFADLQEHF